MATGRSDYPNQVNNVLGFPYIFRGALDVRATTINLEMKLAAVKALAELAQEDVPDEVAAAYEGARPRFGREYIIPAPFDPRLISVVPSAVASAAMESGVARKPIEDMKAYRESLSARRDPVAGALQMIFQRVRRYPKRVVFAEGEEEQVIRAAVSFVNQGLGSAILVGYEDRIQKSAQTLGIDISGITIANARLSQRNAAYTDYLYEKLQRQGYLWRDCVRLINTDRNNFAAAMVALGDADAMVTGVTRNFSIALEDVRRVIDQKPGHRLIGASLVIARGRTVLVADTAITEMPTAEEIAQIAIEAAGVSRRLGYEPRVALLAFATFGHPRGERSARVQEAVRILDQMHVDFEYDGEMAADVALNKDAMAAYPFCRLKDTANVLVMPAFHSASISTKMLQELGGATVLGPLIVGLDKPVQFVPLGARDTDIVNMAALAAFNVGG
jgi:malate dehydrogenase (oxaloacetate-decarboxylating)(NADP+)